MIKLGREIHANTVYSYHWLVLFIKLIDEEVTLVRLYVDLWTWSLRLTQSIDDHKVFKNLRPWAKWLCSGVWFRNPKNFENISTKLAFQLSGIQILDFGDFLLTLLVILCECVLVHCMKLQFTTLVKGVVHKSLESFSTKNISILGGRNLSNSVASSGL